MSKKYFYRTCCVQCDSIIDRDKLNKMVDDPQDITYRTMLKHCHGLLDWAVEHNYDRRSDQGLTLRNDWHVSYHKGVWGNEPCYFLKWSGIEFIWVLGVKPGVKIEEVDTPSRIMDVSFWGLPIMRPTRKPEERDDRST